MTMIELKWRHTVRWLPVNILWRSFGATRITEYRVLTLCHFISIEIGWVDRDRRTWIGPRRSHIQYLWANDREKAEAEKKKQLKDSAFDSDSVELNKWTISFLTRSLNSDFVSSENWLQIVYVISKTLRAIPLAYLNFYRSFLVFSIVLSSPLFLLSLWFYVVLSVRFSVCLAFLSVVLCLSVF